MSYDSISMKFKKNYSTYGYYQYLSEKTKGKK